MGEYKFSENWQSTNPKIAKKINDLLKSIDREGPMQGLGHPERLKSRRPYSRKIDEANRLVYEVSNDIITIQCCLGHYDE